MPEARPDHRRDRKRVRSAGGDSARQGTSGGRTPPSCGRNHAGTPRGVRCIHPARSWRLCPATPDQRAFPCTSKRWRAMKRTVATFKTDKEAEDFFAKADLTEYDLSGGQVVRFELRAKDKTVSVRLPEQLLHAGRRQAEKGGMPYQRYIRMGLEKAVGGPGP